MSEIPMTYRFAINSIPVLDKPDKQFPWSDYIERFELRDVTPGELLYAIGTGHGFAPVFRGRPSIQNFVEASFLAVDMDTEDSRSSMAALKSHPLVACHGAIIYPTHSHKPESPRHRIVFLLDRPISSSVAYKQACETINWLFPGCDTSTGPAKTWMSNAEIDCYNRWDECYFAPGFSFAAEMLTTYMLQYKRTVKPVRSEPTFSSEEFFGSKERMSLPELRQHLARVDPYSMDREEWVRLGAAIAHCYGDQAYFIFRDWSDRPGHGRMSIGEWKSMTRDHPKAAGYGTIIKMLGVRR